jgi:geranylgeranyl transferase type-2 subunit beta
LNYLTELTLKLALGANHLDEDTRSLHRAWLQAQQREDGGFAGREGNSDPYYTAFGLRGLLIVDGIDANVAKAAAGFIRSQLDAKLGVVDLISLIMAASILEFAAGGEEMSAIRASGDRVSETLLSLRSSDGGYAKTPGGVAGSTYQTFLNLLCWELIGREEPEPERVAMFLNSQRQIDGGFREIRVAKRAGVNPTAAGIGSLKALGRLVLDNESATAEFLSEMQTSEGGMAANDRIPMPDLLSSCTGLISLIDLEAVERIDVAKLLRYARSMERREIKAKATGAPSSMQSMMFDWESDDDDTADGTVVSESINSRHALPGGFHGFEFDEDVDVEYTFYGLACLALGELCLS